MTVVLQKNETLLPISEAEPCPFCGHQPTIKPWHGGGPRKRMVGCTNDEGCSATPSVMGATRTAALVNWNCRHVDNISDEEVVQRTNALARLFYKSQGYNVKEDYQFQVATHPQENGMWNLASMATYFLTGRDPDESLDALAMECDDDEGEL